MINTPMDFEITMRLLLGSRAEHIADQHTEHKSRSTWLQRATRKLSKEVDDLNTTVRHRKMMLAELQALSSEFKSSREPTWAMIFAALRLVSRLLGFDYVRAARCHTVEYWQSAPQHHTTAIFEGGDVMRDYYEQKNAVALRQVAARSLRAAGHSEQLIAQALRCTEYELRQLRREEQRAESAA